MKNLLNSYIIRLAQVQKRKNTIFMSIVGYIKNIMKNFQNIVN